MTTDNNPNTFDAHYYAQGCGRPYQRDQHWLDFFDAIADKIVKGVQPKTVLDAGCAMGFLVEGLRNHGVEAWGVDISDYAIKSVHESIAPYCWVDSVAEPLPRKYDLIVTIEVLEHMDSAEAERAIANFCQHTDDIIFSSSPFDYKEATHFNVQNPEVWAELFAQHGFYRDVDFDASFLTPWAVRFRRNQEPIHRITRDYERRFWLLWKETTDLRALATEMRAELVQLDANLAEKERQLLVKDQQQALLQHRSGELDDILNSRAWRFVKRLERLRLRLIPQDSARERVYHKALPLIGRLVGKFSSILKRVRISRHARANLPQHNYTYPEWIRDHELGEEELQDQQVAAADFTYQPLISFVTPVYNPSPAVLRAAIQSVLAQTYPHWQLCLADGSTNRAQIQPILDEFAKSDERIELIYLEENLGISGNTNAALELADGEFIAILDHDDLLAPNMLFEVVQRLLEKPETDIIYFDEDKVDESGEVRSRPFLKPDWAPEMLLSANYLTHSVMRRSLVVDVGGFDPEKDGTQDWDLAFKLIERTSRIEHIPQVLYHWRQIQGSAASRLDAKSYVFDRQCQSVEEHLIRQGIDDPQVSFVAPGFLRSVWPTQEKKVSIIIPTQDRLRFLNQCLDSIFRLTAYPNYEIILVDNQSRKPETLKFYEKLLQVKRVKLVEYNAEFNYNTANNLGAQHASGEYLLFLNNDIEVITTDWLDELVRWAERPGVGVVGSKLCYPDQTIQHAGIIVGMQGHASHLFWGMHERQNTIFGSMDWYRNFMAVTGACMMMPRSVFDELGQFDENYTLVFSDVEICVRAVEKGYRVVYTPYAPMIHYEGKTRGVYMPSGDLQRGAEHFSTLIDRGDPYYNPNLSYNYRVPVFRMPGEETRRQRLDRVIGN